ncbi:Rne/Rng family ribonuclease [Cellulomonas alba]|uniref:Rne/Rng family ribonuclease n=1 Tax=Cellulomonas alba TaxID=3053467 RepID=A0ABT7SCN9_9CELL|nr:Rne/Rng family ribonuclease [Cellulomonas alba]MDM7853945.1 Rne/Rng family ribonuclease [Cellulomonas alba]
MSPEITPENEAAASTAGGEAAPAAPRRRRATRAVAAPVAAEQSAEPTPDAAPAATEPAAVSADAPAEAEPAAAPKRTRAPRRATKATAPTEPDAPAAAAEAEPAAAAADAVTSDEPAAETKPARRRRSSTRAAAAPASRPEPAEEPAEGAEEPAEDEADEATAASDAPLDVLAELAATVGEPAKQPERPAGGARLATTALLFQAPDPAARPRRRRAQAGAGSPEQISEAARAEHAQAEPAKSEGAAVATPAADETGPSRSSRRRRGGRGRSGASAATDETQEAAAQPAEAADEPEAEDVVLDETGEPVDVDEVAEGDEDESTPSRRRRRRGGRGRRRPDASRDAADEVAATAEDEPEDDEEPAGDETEAESADGGPSSRRRRRRRRGTSSGEGGETRTRTRAPSDEVTALRGSTRLEAKRQRRREGRDAGRRRQIITEAEFLARRESVERSMIVRERHGRTQIAVLEDGVLVEHYVSNQAQVSMVGNVYLGRVQNVLPSMEAAFVDVGKGRNAVLYAGEVNWDAAGLDGGQPRRIEQALKSGDSVLVQVTKDPIGHKGARLTSQVTLAGRYLVYVPGGGMTGISRKLPDTERNRLKKILREVVPDSAGVIVRTAAEGASEDELRADVERLSSQWEAIEKKAKTASAPALLQGEPDMAIRVVRDIFNDDFSSLVVEGDEAWSTISSYIAELAPDLAQKVQKWTGTQDVFTVHRIDEQLAKGMDRKVWLPSGGSLVIDRTEAMTVVDVNTGKFTGSGGTLEETVTRNNLEAAEEIVRQLRLRDIGGIIVIDFIDMVLESNRDLVLRRLVECLGRDRTKHQVAEVTSLGLVQMTRKRVGQGLVEAFSETCEHCHGRGFIVHDEPVEKNGRPDAGAQQQPETGEPKRSRRKRGGAKEAAPAAGPHPGVPVLPEAREAVKATLATIAAAAAHAHEHDHEHDHPAGVAVAEPGTELVAEPAVVGEDEAATQDVADAPVLDVLAELDAAGFGEHGDDVPAVARDEAPAPVDDARTADADTDADEAQTLELTPVDPQVFDAETPEDD